MFRLLVKLLHLDGVSRVSQTQLGHRGFPRRLGGHNPRHELPGVIDCKKSGGGDVEER